MGAFAAVAQGSDQDPALITMRYEGAGARCPLLGFIGKAVTFDSGGISLKPAEGMEEMKYDMSGGAAVIGAIEAIARLELPVRVIGVVGATENLQSGRAVKPGDIVRTLAGLSVEINNTDAEGRLVLADCIAHAISLGAERIVDLATLTGSIVVALGRTHAGLLGNDDEWCAQVARRGAPNRRARLADAVAPRVRGSSSRAPSPMSTTRRPAGGPARSRRRSSSTVSRARHHGRTSTSPARRMGSGDARTPRRARRASACACSPSSRARSPRAAGFAARSRRWLRVVRVVAAGRLTVTASPSSVAAGAGAYDAGVNGL